MAEYSGLRDLMRVHRKMYPLTVEDNRKAQIHFQETFVIEF